MLSHVQAVITTATQMVELYQALLRDQESGEGAALFSPGVVEMLLKGLLETRDAMFRVIETHTGRMLLEGRVEELSTAISLLHWSDWCTPERRSYVESFGLPSPLAADDAEARTLLGRSLLDASHARLFALSSQADFHLSAPLSALFQECATFYASLYMERATHERALFARLRLPGPTVVMPTSCGRAEGMRSE